MIGDETEIVLERTPNTAAMNMVAKAVSMFLGILDGQPYCRVAPGHPSEKQPNLCRVINPLFQAMKSTMNAAFTYNAWASE